MPRANQSVTPESATNTMLLVIGMLESVRNNYDTVNVVNYLELLLQKRAELNSTLAYNKKD